MTSKKHGCGKHKETHNMEHEAKEMHGTIHGMGHGGLQMFSGMFGGFKKKPKM